MRGEDLYEELWVRDDGWAVRVIRDHGSFVAVDRLPLIVEPPPNPLTYEYVEKALRANGYDKMWEEE